MVDYDCVFDMPAVLSMDMLESNLKVIDNMIECSSVLCTHELDIFPHFEHNTLTFLHFSKLIDFFLTIGPKKLFGSFKQINNLEIKR
jgi:hypothetical protein